MHFGEVRGFWDEGNVHNEGTGGVKDKGNVRLGVQRIMQMTMLRTLQV